MVTRAADNASESRNYDEQRFRKIFEEGPLGMALADTHRTLVQVNARFCGMLGYTQDEVIGRRIDDITHPDDLNAGLDLLGQLVRGEIPRYQMEKRYLRKDGTPVPVMINVSVLRSASGEAEHLLGMVEEITARKCAEQALRESRQKLSLALEAIQAALSHWDLRSGKVEWNDRCYELLGYKPGAFTPNLDIWRSQLHPEDRARVEAEIHQCAEQHKDILTEYRIALPDGTLRWVRAARRFDYDASGKAITCTSLLYDITDAKQTEAALREGRDRLTLAIDAAQAGTALWNLKTGDLQWNARTFQIMGHPPCSFIPTVQRWRSQVHPEDITQTEDRFAQCVKEHRDFTDEHRIIRPNGEMRWVRLMARVSYDADGCPASSTAIATDITEAKETETQLRNAKDAAEAASQAKDQFLAMLSHELRTPLAPIATAAQLLEADPSLSAQQQELVGMVKRNTELEARLIDDLLDLTRISRGKLWFTAPG